VDADKRFDANLVYFWALDQMLDVGGSIAWGDCDWPAPRKLMRFIAQHPNYEVRGTFGRQTLSRKRSLYYTIGARAGVGAWRRDSVIRAQDAAMRIDA